MIDYTRRLRLPGTTPRRRPMRRFEDHFTTKLLGDIRYSRCRQPALPAHAAFRKPKAARRHGVVSSLGFWRPAFSNAAATTSGSMGRRQPLRSRRLCRRADADAPARSRARSGSAWTYFAILAATQPDVPYDLSPLLRAHAFFTPNVGRFR